jgi:DedD protein
MQANVRTSKEKLAVTLDGRQIASVVVGALVILAVVFVLGLNVGRQIGARQAEASRAGSLEALDKAPRGAPVPETSLTFHRDLTGAKPEARPPPAAAPQATPAAPAPAAQPPPPVQAEASPPPAAGPADEPPAGAFTIQLGATSDRGEADRIAAKYEAYRPRVEAAEVSGKRVYRVRVGSFETREAAGHYLADVTRETGAQGWVTSSR